MRQGRRVAAATRGSQATLFGLTRRCRGVWHRHNTGGEAQPTVQMQEGERRETETMRYAGTNRISRRYEPRHAPHTTSTARPGQAAPKRAWPPPSPYLTLHRSTLPYVPPPVPLLVLVWLRTYGVGVPVCEKMKGVCGCGCGC